MEVARRRLLLRKCRILHENGVGVECPYSVWPEVREVGRGRRRRRRRRRGFVDCL